MCAVSVAKISPTALHSSYINGPKTESAQWCGQAFSNQKDLIHSLSILTGEKLYECVECGKAFAHMSGLKRHKGIHRREKPFECNVCGRLSVGATTSFGTPSSTLGRSLMSAVNVGRPSAATPLLVTIKGCTVTAAVPVWQHKEDHSQEE